MAFREARHLSQPANSVRKLASRLWNFDCRMAAATSGPAAAESTVLRSTDYLTSQNLSCVMPRTGAAWRGSRSTLDRMMFVAVPRMSGCRAFASPDLRAHCACGQGGTRLARTSAASLSVRLRPLCMPGRLMDDIIAASRVKLQFIVFRRSLQPL